MNGHAAPDGSGAKKAITMPAMVLEKLITVTDQNRSAPTRRNAFQLACRIAAKSARAITGSVMESVGART